MPHLGTADWMRSQSRRPTRWRQSRGENGSQLPRTKRGAGESKGQRKGASGWRSVKQGVTNGGHCGVAEWRGCGIPGSCNLWGCSPWLWGDSWYWPDAAPFDGIIVTAVAESVPPKLIDQLKPGGRIVIPLGPAHGAQQLTVGTRTAEGLELREVLPVQFVPFTRSAPQEP